MKVINVIILIMGQIVFNVNQQDKGNIDLIDIDCCSYLDEDEIFMCNNEDDDDLFYELIKRFNDDSIPEFEDVEDL